MAVRGQVGEDPMLDRRSTTLRPGNGGTILDSKVSIRGDESSRMSTNKEPWSMTRVATPDNGSLDINATKWLRPLLVSLGDSWMDVGGGGER